MTKLVKSNLLWIVVLLIFYALLFKPTERNIFNVSFVDEEENFSIGQWVIKGQKIYREVFSQHQPVPMVLSSFIQQLTKPNSTFLLVKRHREFIFFYSALWFILLTWRFGKRGLAAAFLFELSKFNLLGNLFLAESLAVPPLLYLLGISYDLLNQKLKTISRSELVFIGMMLVFIVYTLLAQSVFVLAVFLLIFWLLPKPKKLFFVISALLVFVLVFSIISKYVSWTGFVHDVLWINYTIVVFKEQARTLDVYLRMFFFPLTALFLPNDGLYFLTKTVSVIYIASFLILIVKRKFRACLFSFIALVVTNLRPLPFKTVYNTFHLVPFYASLLFMTVLQLSFTVTLLKGLNKYILNSVTVIILALIIVPFGIQEFKNNPVVFDMWYVRYSQDFDYGETIRLLSAAGDTVLVVPAGPLVYWQSGLLPSSRYYFTYDFMFQSPQLVNDITSSFTKNPPDFFKYNVNYGTNMLVEKVFRKSIDENYTMVKLNGKESYLYIRNDRLSKISDETWNKVKRYGFSM